MDGDAAGSECSDQTGDPPQGFGFGCTGSEMGHLFNVAPLGGLGNPNDLDDNCSPNCLTNTGPFVNFRQAVYWSGTEFASNPLLAWPFNTVSGFQSFELKGLQFYGWAVRPGQVGPAPGQAQPVPALGAWGLGLLGLMLVGVARARLR